MWLESEGGKTVTPRIDEYRRPETIPCPLCDDGEIIVPQRGRPAAACDECTRIMRLHERAIIYKLGREARRERKVTKR